MMGLSWLVLALAGGVQATEFQLDTDTPDSLCPELSITREAVRQRLGQLETEAGGRWHGIYSNVHDPAGRRGDYVRLIIRDGEGREQLKRELPLKGESCETLAQAIALVVDGYFRELAQGPAHEDSTEASRTPHLEPAQVAPSAPASSGVPAPVPTGKPILAAKPRPHSGASQIQTTFTFGAGFESAPTKPTAVVGMSLGRPRHWRLQLEGGFPFSAIREREQLGYASGYAIPVRLSLSNALAIGPRIEWLLGPEILLSLEHGATQEVPAGRSGWRVSPGVGAQTGVAWWVTQSVALSANAALDEVLFESRRFLMYDRPVLELSRTRFSGGIGFWAVIWP